MTETHTGGAAWQTSGYMISRDGDTCTLWLSGQDAYQVCSVDPTMPDWLFDPGLNYHGMGVAFRVKIPRDYVKAESLEGITWSDWERQPYDRLTELALFDELTRHFYPDGAAQMTDTDLNRLVTPKKRRGGSASKCPICWLRRIKGCTACFWSQGCCREEKK